MISFLRYAKNRFLYNVLRILIIAGIGFLIGSCEVKADELQDFNFMDKGNNSFIINSNSSVSGTFSVVVEDMTQAYPYVNLLIATTGYPEITITENAYFANTVIKKLYSSGTSTINGYNADLYVIQFATRGTGWNCSSTGANCYISTNLRLKNIYDYNAYYQLQSISLTNAVLTDDYLANMQINQNNQIIEQGKETNDKLDNLNDTLKDNFNECRPSVNLYNPKEAYIIGAFNQDIALNYYYNLTPGETYTFSTPHSWTSINVYDSSDNKIRTYGNSENSYTQTVTIQPGDSYLVLVFNAGNYTDINSYDFTGVQFQKGTISTSYEPFGEEICKNKIDETNDKLDQAENTRKGIWETIKDLPNQFMNMLKGLFIPEDGYFEYWFNDLKSFFETKLGFLATPFTIFVEFIEKYLELDSSADIIINIPDITVPNFEDYVIVHATSFNWTETLKSKDSLNALWQLYLAFIDVYLILNFINFCETKYNRIFGGDTANYEYYTVEDSYTYDNNTGEVLSSRRNERKTTRKKVE